MKFSSRLNVLLVVALIVVVSLFGVMVQCVDPDDFNILNPGEEATYTFDDEDDVVYYKLESSDSTANMVLLSGFIEVCSGRANVFIKECSPSIDNTCDFSDQWVPSATNNDRQLIIQPTAPLQYPTGICQGGPNVKCSSQISYYIAIVPVTKGVVSRIVISGYTNDIAGRINLITTDNRGLNFLYKERILSFGTPTYCASEHNGTCQNLLVPTPSYIMCIAPVSDSVNIASVCGCRTKPVNKQGCMDKDGITSCLLGTGTMSKLESGSYAINIMVNKEDIPSLPEFAYLPVSFTNEQSSNPVGVAFGVIFAIVAVLVIVGGIVGGVLYYRRYKAKKYEELNVH